MIPPGERRELRAIVRQQMKVLRAEVKQRELELVADAEHRLDARYRDADKRFDDINFRIREMTEDANRQIADFVRQQVDAETGEQFVRYPPLQPPRLWRQQEDRAQLHRALLTGIKSQVADAQLQLDRQEADLLRRLAMESLTSDEAHAFLGRIPTVADLVPSRRLAEIEAAFDSGTHNGRRP